MDERGDLARRVVVQQRDAHHAILRSASPGARRGQARHQAVRVVVPVAQRKAALLRAQAGQRMSIGARH